MAEYILRPAEQGDFPAIRSLIHTVQINPFGLDWRHFIVAVTASGLLLGCGQVKIHADGSRELASIAVQESTRGQGIARAIIEELLRQEAHRPLYLMCRARLETLYAKFGFRAIGAEEMSPYFRKIKRAEQIFNAHGEPEDRLLVMCLE